MNTERQLQLVTFKQAKRLKQVGFNWWTYRLFYNDTGELSNRMTGCFNEEKEYVSAPSVQLALKWMRDVKGIPCSVGYYDTNEHSYSYRKDGIFHTTLLRRIEDRFFYTFELAETELLDELLTLLEKQQ